MNAKFILFLSCFAAVTLAATSVVTAGSRGGGGMGRGGGGMGRGGGAHFSSPTRSAPTFYRGGSGTYRTRSGDWSRSGNWSRRGDWSRSGDWRRHHHRSSRNQFVFIGGFGFPYYWGYPYDYYGYYPYDYYGYDYYDDPGYGYGGSGYGNSSTVVEVQRRLARAGYYHGPIDGIMGPQTRRAIRAYERDYNQPGYGMLKRELPATMGIG